MTSLNVVDSDPATSSSDAVVVGLHSGSNGAGPTLAAGAAQIAAAFTDRPLADVFALLGATGAVGEVTKLATLGTITAPVLAAVGLGPATGGVIPAETLRRAAGAASRALAGTRHVTLALAGDDVQAIAEGALLGAYQFAGYKTRDTAQRREPVTTISICTAEA